MDAVSYSGAPSWISSERVSRQMSEKINPKSSNEVKIS